MYYLIIYILVGVIIFIIDFSIFPPIILWKIRCLGKDEILFTLIHGPKPNLDLYSKPIYFHKRNYIILLFIYLFWPIKIIFSPKNIAFVRNLRAGRIKLHKKNEKKVYHLNNRFKKYQNIVNHFSFGLQKNEWIEFSFDNMNIVIHNKELFENMTLENLNCKEGQKVNYYFIEEIAVIDDVIMWQVEMSHVLFNVRMYGYGSSDIYKEDVDGNIFHINQIKSSIY